METTFSRKLEHLKLIQNVIERMARESSLMKRYSIVATAVGAGTYQTMSEPVILLITILGIVCFWGLDARYLQQEHWFRNMYDEVRIRPDDGTFDFELTPSVELRDTVEFWDKVFNWSTMPLYAVLASLIGVVRLIIA
jgi:hypothetical protein